MGPDPRHPPAQSVVLVTISIIIISDNRMPLINHTLSAVWSHISKLPDYTVEILVVNNDPNYITPANHRPPLRHLSPPPQTRNNFAALRNFGLKKASGDIIVFLDDDCLPTPRWLETLIAPIVSKTATATGGGILFQPTNSTGLAIAYLGFPAGGLQRIIRSGTTPVRSPHLSTGNAALNASVLSEVGYFNESLPHGGEDQVFFETIAQRYPTLFVPQAIVLHKQRDTISAVFKWFVRRGQADFNRIHLDHTALKALVPSIRGSMTVRLACLLLLINLSIGWPLLLGLFIIYSSVIIGRTLFVNRIPNTIGHEVKFTLQQFQRPLFRGSVLLHLPLVKLTMDIGCEIGRWIAFFKTRHVRYH